MKKLDAIVLFCATTNTEHTIGSLNSKAEIGCSEYDVLDQPIFDFDRKNKIQTPNDPKIRKSVVVGSG